MREVDRMDILLNSYYAPIRLPDDNRYALKQALYDLLKEKLPKEREWDRSEPYDNPDTAQGHNEAVDEMVSAINQLFGREE